MGRRIKRDPGDLRGKSAPGALELVRAFVNTKYGRRHNEISTAGQLRTWLVRHGLLGRSVGVTGGDLRRALETREAIRALLRANNGIPLEAGCVDVLNNTGRHAPLRAFFDQRAQARLGPDTGGVDGALGSILSRVVMAMADGSWPRLKVCRNDPCEFAYFDRSKNRSAVWCAMSICGNRINARLYRQRRKPGRHRTRRGARLGSSPP